MASDLFIVYGYKTLKSRDVVAVFNNIVDALTFIINCHDPRYIKFNLVSSCSDNSIISKSRCQK